VSYIVERLIWYKTMPRCHGIILYDFNEETYDMNLEYLMALPTFYINGDIGEDIYDNCVDYWIDYSLEQSWNDEAISYNVIGEIPGINQDETVVVGCLYDSWWNQGTADSAIGMAIVLAVAKYFKDNGITPNRNVRFVAFSGEEYGGRGAYCYELAHRDENIVTVIDLNQLGYWQTEFEGKPRQTLNVIVNSESLNSTVRAITDRTDYESRMGDVADYRTATIDIFNPFSDYTPFFQSNMQGFRSCNTVCILKAKGADALHPWVLHHRDGQGHTDGDSMKYFDPVDVNVTAEMVWNVTKYFTLEI
jgi:Zn-dependent M28 family amino/carboxypeptidase